MAYQIIPLTNDPNKTLKTTVSIGDSNVTLTLFFHYNEIAKYWCMRVTNSSNVVLIDSLPLVTGEYPAGNILAQYSYLNIGKVYLVKVTKSELNYPDDNTLGTTFILGWSS